MLGLDPHQWYFSTDWILNLVSVHKFKQATHSLPPSSRITLLKSQDLPEHQVRQESFFVCQIRKKRTERESTDPTGFGKQHINVLSIIIFRLMEQHQGHIH